MASDRCDWRPCEVARVGLSIYCADHREEARRNELRALGLHAPASAMWRDGDEAWLLTDTGVTEPMRRVVVRSRMTGRRADR